MQETQEKHVLSLGQEDPLEEKWQPIPVFLPENSMDRGAWWATVRGVSKNWTRLSQTQLTLHLHKVEMTNGINDCHS